MEEELADQLRNALYQQAVPVAMETCDDVATLRASAPDVVFSGFTSDLTNLLNAVTVPVVIVSRHPETSEYLDAMDAGAADYCSAPFEPSHIHWILKRGDRP
jgi:DNA-binding response OmpR family regulator